MKLMTGVVRMREARKMTDARVDGLVLELASLGLELGARRGDVGYAEADRHLVTLGAKVRAHRLGRDQRERDVAELVLDPPLARVGVSIEAERLAVELVGPLQVLDWNGDEIGSLHAEISQPTLPSETGSGGSSRPRTPTAAPS